MAAAQDLQAILERIGPRLHLARSSDAAAPRVLTLWKALDEVLPDGGLPRGVVELAAPGALGGATSVALAAVRAGQARAKEAWCAWIDPHATLHAPGVAAAGVDLSKMLVVRMLPRDRAARIAVKIVASGAFEVVAIDVDGVTATGTWTTAGRRAGGAEVLVRKLALAAEPSGATVLLLTDSSRRRAAAWPVALRVELSRPGARTLSVRIGKDKRGRVGSAKTIPFEPIVGVAG